MIVVALLLLVVAAAAVLFIAVTGSAEPVQLAWDAVNVSWAPTALAVFLLGAAVMLVTEAGVGLLLRGNRKNWQRRQELKRLRRVESRHTAAGGGASSTGAASRDAAGEGAGPTSAPTGGAPSSPGTSGEGSTGGTHRA